MGSQGLTSLLWFVVILALIPVALWLLRRTPMGGAAAQGILRSVAALPLSPTQRIVTVEVGAGAERRWLVLGVSPHSITTLHTMSPQPDSREDPTPSAPVPGFARMLSTLRGAPGRDDAR